MEQQSEGERPILEFGAQAMSITNYTIYQSGILMNIFAACQQDIHDAISQQTKDKESFVHFTPTEASEQMRHRKIWFSQLEPNRKHYPRLREGLLQMSKLPVYVPRKKNKKENTYCYFPQLFTVDFCYDNHKPCVVLSVRTALLYYYLSNVYGYHRIDLGTYFRFRRNSTRQLYRMGDYCMHFGNTFTPQFLNSKLSIDCQYRGYGDVESRLLKPAQDEMENLYQQQRCDIHFHYLPLFGKGEAEKVCEKVRLVFTTRSDEHPQGKRLNTLLTHQARFKYTFVHDWDINEKVAVSICQRIRLDMVEDLDYLIEKKAERVEQLRKKHCTMGNKAGFLINAIKEYMAAKGVVL